LEAAEAVISQQHEPPSICNAGHKAQGQARRSRFQSYIGANADTALIEGNLGHLSQHQRR
jgi:hypothetical protein